MKMPDMKATIDCRPDRATLRAEIAMRVLLSWAPVALANEAERKGGCAAAVGWADSLLAVLEAKDGPPPDSEGPWLPSFHPPHRVPNLPGDKAARYQPCDCPTCKAKGGTP